MKMLLALAFIAVATLTLNAADLGGTWKGSMETQMGAMDITITLQPGPAPAGEVKAGEYQGAIENGKADGNRISFEANIEPGSSHSKGPWPATS